MKTCFLLIIFVFLFHRISFSADLNPESERREESLCSLSLLESLNIDCEINPEKSAYIENLHTYLEEEGVPLTKMQSIFYNIRDRDVLELTNPVKCTPRTDFLKDEDSSGKLYCDGQHKDSDNKIIKVRHYKAKTTSLKEMTLPKLYSFSKVLELSLPPMNEIIILAVGLTEFPPEILKQTTLRVLNLSHNCLTIIPEKISNLKELRKLILAKNFLKTVPNEMGMLEKLDYLSLANNELYELPDSFNEIKLDFIDITGNAIKEEPSFFIKLRNLKGRAYLEYDKELKE